MRATMHLCGLLLGLLTTCLPAPASEPGLLFHAGFDGTLQAESLARAGEPIADQGPEPVFEPGRIGQALVCGRGMALPRYPVQGNLIPASGTVSFWVQPLNWTPEDPNFHVFFEAGVDRKTGWLILYKYFQSGWLLLRYADERGKVGMATAGKLGWEPGEWHHIAATWAPHGLLIYVDGELAARAPTPLVAGDLGATFKLGDDGWHVPHEGARTLVDDVRIYAYPLSAAEIRRLSGRGQLTVSRDAQGDQWHVRLEGIDPDSTQRVAVDIRPAGGDDVVASFGAQLDGRTATLSVPVADLARGEYQVSARAVNADGEVTLVADATVKRLEPERITLENGLLKLTFDGGTGALIGLEDSRNGRQLRQSAAPAPI